MSAKDSLLLVLVAYTVLYVNVATLSSLIISASWIIYWIFKKELVMVFILLWRLLGTVALHRLWSLSKPASIFSMSWTDRAQCL